ncbi:uncharacterized protein LOC118794636 [Megalops cyprinoides]|uniref:uncharacterized protein LOC118794636 n=1 Tax=Megalops cyprinoides TaxID=118141 RepID=UPI0018645A59|nr:uncharacterized protein LOC118794636 [Megalops cyprinoides]
MPQSFFSVKELQGESHLHQRLTSDHKGRRNTSTNRNCEPEFSAMAQPQHDEIHMEEEDTETQLAVDRNRTDRVVTVMGRMGLGLVLGAAGGYPLGTSMSATEEAIESLMTNTLITNKTELAEMDDMAVLVKLVGFHTGIILGLASSVIGIAFGKAAVSAVLRMKGPESGPKALAAAGPVALLGVTATGAAMGAVTEKIASAIRLKLDVRSSLSALSSVIIMPDTH